MTKGLRWRIIVLQLGLMGILSFAAGFAFWGNSFSIGQVHDNLPELAPTVARSPKQPAQRSLAH